MVRGDGALRILFLSNDYAYFAAHRSNIVERLASLDAEMTIAGGNVEGDRMPFPGGSIPALPLPIDFRRLSPARDLATLREIRRLIRRLEPDIVHSFTLKPNLFACLVCAWYRMIRGRAPSLVITFAGLGRAFRADENILHATRNRLVRFALYALVEKAGAVVTCESADDAATLTAAKIARPDRTIVTNGSGIDPRRYSSLPKAQAPLNAVFAGRLLRAKGAGLFLELAQSAKLREFGWRFLVAGWADSADPDSLSPEELNLAAAEGWLEWRGKLDAEEMGELLGQSHALCLPTAYNEGVPRILSEGALCECAILTTEKGNRSSLVLDGETGFVLDANPEAFETALVQLASDPARIARMGRAARQRAVALGIDDRTVTDRFLEAYGLARQPGPG